LTAQLRLMRLRRRGEDRLLFGQVLSRVPLSAGGDLLSFLPGLTFGFVRWRGDGYGTQTWRVVVAEAARSGDEITTIPGVEPGAILLFHAFGKTRVHRALTAIEALKKDHDLASIDATYWRHLHLAIQQDAAADPYDAAGFDALALARDFRSGV
jgi:hypothetical protein